MGALREWTASDVAPLSGAGRDDDDAQKEEKSSSEGDPPARAAAVRGAAPATAEVDHRCAHRAAVAPTASGDDLGFRCCRGAPNAASIPAPEWQQTYRRAEIAPAQIAEMLSTVPHLREIAAGGISFFTEPDDTHAVLARADAGAAPPNTTLTTSPLLWNPVPGEEVLVVAGRSDKHSFVVAFHRLPGDRYRLAASFLMKDERGPVALGFNGYVRRRLSWAICWDCRGESGNITYRDDHRVVITQK
jgi:hypothetical protein